MAAAGGNAEVVKVLLAAGANVHVTSNVSGEEGERLDFIDGAPYMRGGVTKTHTEAGL
jgi:hypothetical protein